MNEFARLHANHVIRMSLSVQISDFNLTSFCHPDDT
ncbi:hypothetical protein HDG40_000579 [Paraburkholderia sp. JPY158]|uniref:Uncharacterized protein n=1 Tax=Paraburkholderia atlantica TaxID=2654982 RepID=A0A7W8V4A9_PARAM|nr:hypothetical protein [Paraburkholderia atlantica]